MAKENTLDMFTETIRKDLLDGKYTPKPFKDSSSVEKHLITEMARLAKLGDFAYDPQIGEITLKFEEAQGIDLFGRLDDGRVVHNVLVEFFQAQGWDHVSCIPARIGNNKAIIRLRSDKLSAMELTKKTK